MALTKKQTTTDRQQKKQKRKADEGQLQQKRKEMDKAKVNNVPPRTKSIAIFAALRSRTLSSATRIFSAKQNFSSTLLISR